jgi:hypothetical protein
MFQERIFLLKSNAWILEEWSRNVAVIIKDWKETGRRFISRKEVIQIQSNWYIWGMFLAVLILLGTQRKRRHRIIRKNKRLHKKGIKRIMPTEMLNECIGKEVIICVEGELSGFRATVLSIEENWIKVEEKNNIRMINGDMITQIYIPKKRK